MRRFSGALRVIVRREASVKTTLMGFLVAAAVFPGVILAQGTINTYAGSDALFAGAGKPAISAQLVAPNNIAVDSQGNIYFSDSGLSQVLKVAANRKSTRLNSSHLGISY